MVLTVLQTAITLPQPVQVVIAAVVGFVVSWLLTQVTLKWPFLATYLGPYRDQVVTGASAYAIVLVVNALSLIPAQYTDLVVAVLNVVAIAASLWLLPFLTMKHFQRKGMRSFRLTP
jgi:hypothetical protein